ncbi:related to CLC chloride channel protein [Rhynchosporium graminicola]|uniref:Related to CLC chloride channel protein n=1 Tax=Rhynchosporium graminicola TaxID=2792576 RepID=A0A1E1JXM6_9HELO|nr:related to CLC chloride channel protein [Rhynchosporium commune]
MSHDEEANENSRLLDPRIAELRGGKQRTPIHDEASSIVSSHVPKEGQELAGTAIGERLPYNDYTTIDRVHDLVSARRSIDGFKSTTPALGFMSRMDSRVNDRHSYRSRCFLVDNAVATISEYKVGYCSSNVLQGREACCMGNLLPDSISKVDEFCSEWKMWAENYWTSFGIYVGFALLFGIIAGGVIMTTRANLPAVRRDDGDLQRGPEALRKSMYMAAGGGIPEIKIILSGFVISHFLDFKLLLVKAIGATFAVSTGMCLGKEGPFVHISTCVGYLVASLFPKYRENGKKMREMLSVACSAGLSVAFGSLELQLVAFCFPTRNQYVPPPKSVLYRAFVCSLFAAIVLKALNPTGTGKLVLFDSSRPTTGSTTTRSTILFSYSWVSAEGYSVNNPVFELFPVVLVTVLLQFPNPLTRDPVDIIIKNLLVDCRHPAGSWELPRLTGPWNDFKLVLTVVTFGCKVPSGIIIPALDVGALFSRLIGQIIPTDTPGMFAMVGAAAFLAGVSRMTVSLAVIIFELTGEVDYIPPFMIAIMVASWVADAISR